MALIQWSIPGVRLVSLPVAPWLGFRKTMWIVMAIAVLIVTAPYACFGVWGLWGGVPLASVLDALEVVWGAFPLILAHMALGSVVYATAGGAVQYGWLRWRSA